MSYANQNAAVSVIRAAPRKYFVIEEASANVLHVASLKKEACEFANLALGKGFEGWTPRFCLNPQHQNLNEEKPLKATSRRKRKA